MKNTVVDYGTRFQSFENGMPDIPPTKADEAPPEGIKAVLPLMSPPSDRAITSVLVPVPQLPRADFNPDGPYEFDAEMSLPRGAKWGVIKFAPMPTLQMLTNFDTNDEGEQARFVRPEQEEDQEQPVQTLYAVDNDGEVESIPTVHKKTKSEGWGANMFSNHYHQWKCGTCYVHNALNLIRCLACETVRPGHAATAASTTPAPVITTASSAPFSFGIPTPSDNTASTEGLLN